MCCVEPGAVQSHSPSYVQRPEDHRDLLLQHGPCQAGVEQNVGGHWDALQHGETITMEPYSGHKVTYKCDDLYHIGALA